MFMPLDLNWTHYIAFHCTSILETIFSFDFYLYAWRDKHTKLKNTGLVEMKHLKVFC